MNLVLCKLARKGSVTVKSPFPEYDSKCLSRAEVSISNHTILAQFCKDHQVGLVVVGPEVPLAAGWWPPGTWTHTAGLDLFL